MRLNELRQQDFRLVYDLCADMTACRDFVELENCVHANIRNIVDGDVSVWNLINTDGTIVYGSCYPQFGENFWRDIVPIIAENILQHPYIRELAEYQPNIFSKTNSDCRFFREYFESELHNDAYLKWNLQDQCHASFLADSNTYIVLSINRSKRSFSSRDRQVIAQFVPHFSNCFHMLAKRQKLEQELLKSVGNSDRIENFWLIISSLLYIRNGSPNAQAMLRKLFPGHFSLVDLPEALDAELRRVMDGVVAGVQSSARFIINTPSSRVAFELEQVDPVTFKLTGTLPASNRPDHDFLSEKRLNASLSPRELDVLGWTLEGKLTPEIGMILGIRPKTVESHLKSIYEKLGVHHRVDVIRALAPRREFTP